MHMNNRPWIAMAGLVAVFASLSILRAQTPEQSGTAKTPPGTPSADLSGVWEANMHGLPWADFSFTPDIPPMTPWGKQRYLAAKPSYGPRAVENSTDYVNPTTGKDVGCLPPGVLASIFNLSYLRSFSPRAVYWNYSSSITTCAKSSPTGASIPKIRIIPGWAFHRVV